VTALLYPDDVESCTQQFNVILPTGERNEWAGWGGQGNVGQWQVHLLPTDVSFSGQSVTEDSYQTGVDLLWDPGLPHAPGHTEPLVKTSGSSWSVGDDNDLNPTDNVYWKPDVIRYYQSIGRSGGFTMYQSMQIKTKNGFQEYCKNVLRAGIDGRRIYSERARDRRTCTWPGNQPPVASNISGVQVRAGQSVQLVLVAQDPDGDPLTFSVSQPTGIGQVSLNGSTATYTANAVQAAADDSFTFTANDGAANSNTATVTVTVSRFTVSGAITFKGNRLANVSVSAGNESTVTMLLVVMPSAICLREYQLSHHRWPGTTLSLRITTSPLTSAMLAARTSLLRVRMRSLAKSRFRAWD
jgi:hypothetical protein